MKKSKKLIRRIVRNIRRTYKNKLLGLLLVAISIVATIVTRELTLLIFPGFIGVLLIFTRENLTLF